MNSSTKKPPRRVESDEQVCNLVGTFKGAIGFVEVSSLTPEVLKKVKVVMSIDPADNGQRK